MKKITSMEVLVFLGWVVTVSATVVALGCLITIWTKPDVELGVRIIFSGLVGVIYSGVVSFSLPID